MSINLIRSIQAHSDRVWSLSAHRSLPLLVTASTDKTSRIYKLLQKSNFPLVAVLDDAHKRLVRCAAFKPPLVASDAEHYLDLPVLATGLFDSTISVWGIDEPNLDYDAEEMVQHQSQLLSSPQNEWNLMAIIEGHENEIKGLAWNHTGRLLALCSRDKTVWVWETDPETLEEFECVLVLTDHQQDIKHVTWHPRRDIIASSSYDDTIRIYKQDEHDDDWGCVGVLTGHEGTVWCSQFEDVKGSDTVRLASVSDDMTVRIWISQKTDTEEGTHMGKALPSSLHRPRNEMKWELESILPKAHVYPIYTVSWSRFSGRIALAGCDGKIVVYSKNRDGSWVIDCVQESAHGVSEINSVVWAQLDDKEEKEVLLTAGDDGCVNVWQVA